MDGLRKLARFKMIMIFLLILFFYKSAMSLYVGVFVWDFTPELSGFSGNAFMHAKLAFRAYSGTFHLYFMYFCAAAWAITFVLGHKILVGRIRNARY